MYDVIHFFFINQHSFETPIEEIEKSIESANDKSDISKSWSRAFSVAETRLSNKIVQMYLFKKTPNELYSKNNFNTTISFANISKPILQMGILPRRILFKPISHKTHSNTWYLCSLIVLHTSMLISQDLLEISRYSTDKTYRL